MVRRNKKRAYQSKPAKKNRVKSFVLAVLTLFIAVFLLSIFLLYNFIKAPYSTASESYKYQEGAIFKGNRVNIAAITVNDINDKYSDIKHIHLVNFDLVNKEYSLYELPVDIEIEYALNYGRGPIKHIYSVGNNDQDRGIYLLRKTLLKLLAIKIDGFIILDKNGYQVLTKELGEVDKKNIGAIFRLKNLHRIPGAVNAFRHNVITNLRLSDVLTAITFFRGTTESSASDITLTVENIKNIETFDRTWRKRLKISDVDRERLKVFIMNASKDPKIPGLANWGSRVVENMGSNVLEAQNSLVDFNEPAIITESTDLATFRELQETLDIKKVILISDIKKEDGYNPQVFRTKVSLILTNN